MRSGLPCWVFFAAISLMTSALTSHAQQASEKSEREKHQHHGHHHHHEMELDRDGMVMNNNRTELPKDCAAISEELTFEVRAATIYAQAGFAYGFNQHEWRVPPCSKINVKFINEDQVRHQWMVHGLPKYLYPQGMFHLEASGGKSKQGTFIVPSDNQTYLVHCDLAQHMEKGLKGQLIVGSGNGNLPSIPGVTAHRYPDHY